MKLDIECHLKKLHLLKDLELTKLKLSGEINEGNEFLLWDYYLFRIRI